MLKFAAIASLLFHLSHCCTEFRIKTGKDVLVSRTMEYSANLESHVVVEPRNMSKKASVPKYCWQKMTWKNRYNILYLNAWHSDVYVDGMNDAGLSVGSLMFPGFTKYQQVSPRQCKKAISCLQLAGWILGNFASVREIKDLLQKNAFPVVWGEALKGIFFELHYSITDRTGEGVVIEFTKSGRKVYENKLGIVTNAPNYDFHLLNMKNYIHLSKYARDPLHLGEMTFSAAGQGSGLLGLPGDFTPPSRFVRTAALVHFAIEPTSWKKAVNLAFHIINAVDIPKGVVSDKPTNPNVFERTEWAVVKDLKRNRLYLRTYNDLRIRMIDMHAIKQGMKLEMVAENKSGVDIVDVSTELYQVTEDKVSPSFLEYIYGDA